MAWVLVLAVLLVALANGANDNAKGVGALIGSRMAEARPALRFANLAALIGSLAALVVAVQFDQRLVKAIKTLELAADRLVNVLYRCQNALAQITMHVAIAQLNSLILTRRSTARHRRAALRPVL